MYKQKNFEQVLQICLERIEAGENLQAVLGDFPAQIEELRPALEASLWIRQWREVFDPRPGFTAASRRRLVASIQAREGRRDSLFAWARLPRLWPVYRPGLALRVILFVLLFLSASWSASSLARAAHTWLPGDPLYPLKIAAERIELRLKPGTDQDAQLHIRFAERRLIEVQALTLEGRYEELSPTIKDFAYHIEQVVQEVSRLAQRDPDRARLLAVDLQVMLSKHSGLVDILARFVPAYAQAEFDLVRLVAQESVLRIHDVLSPDSGQAQTLALEAIPGEYVRWARREMPRPAA